MSTKQMIGKKKFVFLLATIWLLLACNTVKFALEGTPTPTGPAITPAEIEMNEVTVAAASSTPLPPSATVDPVQPATIALVVTIESLPPASPEPGTPIPPFSRLPVTADQQATYNELTQAIPPKRDDIALAMAFYGIPQPLPTPTSGENPVLPVGTERSFNILNIDSNTISQINAVLLAVGDHAYFWFDTGPGGDQPDPSTLELVADEFDLIYEDVVSYFGQEGQPGIDGDLRVHVVNASPIALCDVTLDTLFFCGLSGYFSASDGLPVEVDQNSNELDMFVMNVTDFGPGYYLSVLGHEFRHMIEDHYDVGDWDWEVEGSATLAMDLLGIEEGAAERANWFLSEPDQQLNSWPRESSSIPGYGQGFLLNRYLFDRLGADLYRQFATHPLPGFFAVDAVAQANGLSVTGESLWLDWLVAAAIHDDPAAPPQYQFGTTGLNPATMTRLNGSSRQINSTVHQYAADYYDLNGNGNITIQFTGDTLVPVFEAIPASGNYMWLSNRYNYRDMRLTRTVDLTSVTQATLFYQTYYDIEPGYDFAYVSVSTDGGVTWQGLEAEQMQGQNPFDDPSDSAYTDRFYTGESGDWLQEQSDLSAYAGQIIQLRFEYITDPILTHPGIAFDNIAIPEIDFFDDAETVDEGWVAEGFHRVTAYMPQTWQVQVVTFEGGAIQARPLILAQDQTGQMNIDLEAGRGRVIIIVSALAPTTLELGHYQLTISEG